MNNKPSYFFEKTVLLEQKKREGVARIFGHSKFNNEFHTEAVTHFKNGGVLYATYLKYPKENNYKETLDKQIEYKTIEAFEEFIWDQFNECSEKYAHRLLFGPSGLKNPYRNSEVYYDGSVFPICEQEFREIANDKENINVSRMLSFLEHFHHYDFYWSAYFFAE
jgi:hypothetical protein